MPLDDYRPIAEKYLNPYAKRMVDVNPDVISWLSFLFAVAVGYLYFTGILWLLILVAIFTFTSSVLDALDGMVARVSKKASKRGDLLDHVLDRYSDVFILGGIMLSPYCDNLIGFFAILGVLLTSYMGTQAQAIAGKRNYKGLLGRANRLAVLTFLPIAYLIIALLNVQLPYFNLIEWAMVYFAIAGNYTAVHRGYVTWKSLK
jgi:archaetidylinositol phosphate synthase